MANNLIPPDLNRCQAEIKEGSFMTLGPRSMVRCTNKPTVIAVEQKRGSDGLCGSMSLCDSCLTILKKIRPAREYRLVPVEDYKKPHIPPEIIAQMEEDLVVYGNAFVAYKDGKYVRIHPSKVELNRR